MVVRVTCAGVLIGTAEFDPPEGLASANLAPGPGYALAAQAARVLGREFATTQYWTPLERDFADAIATRWEGGRLALEDSTGRELGVNNIVVLEGPPGGPDGSLVRVVADFRPDLARAEAFLRELDTEGDGRASSAA